MSEDEIVFLRAELAMNKKLVKDIISVVPATKGINNILYDLICSDEYNAISEYNSIKQGGEK